MSVSHSDIETAHRRLYDEGIAHETPIETSRSLDAVTGGTIRLKLEHLQRTGSFKIRGAFNKIREIVSSKPGVDHVVTASAGNHAQGVALAAGRMGLDSTVVMPKNAPQSKIDATASYGATVELHGDNFQAAVEYAQTLLSEGAVFVHAYDDPAIVAGQGTLGIELSEQLPELDTVVVPIGGGGLIAGVALALSELRPDTRVVGVQAEGAATVPQSLREGRPQSATTVRTIADGIATGSISTLTYNLIEAHVDSVVTVSETQITESVLFLLERSKQLVEPAGAVTVAAIRSDSLDVSNETAVPVLSGGNLTLTDLRTILSDGLMLRDRLVRLRVRITDKPGEIASVSEHIGACGANIENVRQERASSELAPDEAFLYFRLETTGIEQTERIVASLQTAGYAVKQYSQKC
jgi:threonine dehydratase